MFPKILKYLSGHAFAQTQANITQLFITIDKAKCMHICGRISMFGDKIENFIDGENVKCSA